MRKLLVPVVAIVITLGSAVSGYWLYQRQSGQAVVTAQTPVTNAGSPPVPVSLPGSRRPEFALPDIQGRIRHISEWDGQVIVVNFWATWCLPCLREIPAFVTLQDKYADRGLQFIGIAMQSADEVTGFVMAHDMNYPVLVGELEVIKLAQALGNDSGTLPYTVIIDRQQQITFVRHGELEGAMAEAVITPLL